MAQQLNLLDPRFAPQALRFSARHGLMAVLALLALTAGSAQGLSWAATQASGKAGQLEVLTAPLQARAQALMAAGGTNTTTGPAAEISQLRSLEAGQRRVSQALNAGLAGAREGPSDYLLALARRASPVVWVTGFALDETGAIALEGRMTDSAVLPDYLKSLNNEPRFKGRPFAQLSLQALDAAGVATPYTEFSLRSASSGLAATLPGAAAAGNGPGTAPDGSNPGSNPGNNPGNNAVASAMGLLAGQGNGGTP